MPRAKAKPKPRATARTPEPEPNDASAPPPVASEVNRSRDAATIQGTVSVVTRGTAS